MGLKDFIKNKIQEIRDDMDSEREIKKAEKEAYKEARIKLAKEKANARVKKEIKDMYSNNKTSQGEDVFKGFSRVADYMVSGQENTRKKNNKKTEGFI